MAPPINRRDVLDNYQAVVSSFVTFLEVAVHTLLYERDVYPRTSFKAVRKYNHAVRQSRHPKVCKWIADAMAAVRKEMLKCTVAQVSLVIAGGRAGHPLERVVFDTAAFPVVGPKEHLVPFLLPDQAPPPDPTTGAAPAPAFKPRPTPMIDLTTQLAAVLGALQAASPTLAPVPGPAARRAFTLAIETRDRADGRAGPPPGGDGGRRPGRGPPAAAGARATTATTAPWVPARPGMQRPTLLDRAVAEAGAVYRVAPASDQDGLRPSGEPDAQGQEDPGPKKSPGAAGIEAEVERREIDEPERETGSADDWRVPRELTWAEAEPPYLDARPAPRERERGRWRGGVRTTPVRLVEAGPFVMEVWVEETRAKFEAAGEGDDEEEEADGADVSGGREQGSSGEAGGRPPPPLEPSPIPPKPPRYPEPSRPRAPQQASVEDGEEE